MVERESLELTPREKLRLMKSPLIDGGSERGHELPNLSEFGDRFSDPSIQFERHEEAGMLEVFTDLFFAANYVVFSKELAVTSIDRLGSYAGYFCMLWMTWLVVGLYDVRFVTDSIFERLVRAVHLGVFVGFAVVAPKFNPNDQDLSSMKAMSIILMASRLSLTVEYASILWHVRKFKTVHIPFYIQMSIHFIAAMIYLGITFRFSEDKESRVFITWYIVGALEVVSTLGLSIGFSILSLAKTHLMNRMSLLTIVILGESIVALAEKVVIIVEGPDAWDATVIGILTAGVATTYMLFLIYYDWMKTAYLPPLRQVLWTLLHFPFHLALVLFMQGFTQFIQWSKVIDVINHLSFNWIVDDPKALADTTSVEVQKNITEELSEFFELYHPEYSDTDELINDALANITRIPNAFWPKLSKYWLVADYNLPNDTNTNLFYNIMESLQTAMYNSIFQTFEIDLEGEISKENEETGVEDNSSNAQFASQVTDETLDRYFLVFTYGYIAAGCCLGLMCLLAVVARVTPWKPWPVIRTIIIFLLALGMGLVALLNLNNDKLSAYLNTPWLLPTLCIAWAVVLFLTHIRHDAPVFFKRHGPIPMRRGSREDKMSHESEHTQPMVSNMDGSTSYSGAAGMPYEYQPAPQTHPNNDYV
ncbi:uncharacterized protein TrAFT101_004682 [Trichoderma asperellum]|uniref:Low temperature requirement A n=1 Tax=Trichoderma asperellum (strain ATCC 204424 / CBS 433.97 / NBRC 101777) TaxID=1042311 RepID=A0A2T3Z638_TRIA4|nr:hypothetical protein M441DRAFT_28118 [Trichoderma asperellum CBS 433.97]PTB40264.1 hypothetical protein M441DRAFT_28118 [Trichoderma asperellum CBS 433.97]UKZ89639.1 hypothetical protein TrAFT101_004682 [Trichoderma asperellum]